MGVCSDKLEVDYKHNFYRGTCVRPTCEHHRLSSTGVLEFSKTICVLYFVCNNIPFIVRVFGEHACPANFWGIGKPLKHETSVHAMYAHELTPASGPVSHQQGIT